jgi:hypothetical protein
MRRLCLTVSAAALGFSLGCGGGDTGPKPPLTEEQKKAVQEEDKRVADEEGGNKPPKGKPRK